MIKTHLHAHSLKKPNPFISIFGICSALRPYQFAHLINVEFDLHFQVYFINSQNKQDAQPHTKQASLFQDTPTTQQTLLYCCTELTSGLKHSLHRNIRYQSNQKVISDFPHIDFWWMIQGIIHKKANYISAVQERIQRKEDIIALFNLTPEKINYIHECLQEEHLRAEQQASLQKKR